MNIIERLGITPQEMTNTKIANTAPEMLELLIELRQWVLSQPAHITPDVLDIGLKETIQKATGKTWEEIKELI